MPFRLSPLLEAMNGSPSVVRVRDGICCALHGSASLVMRGLFLLYSSLIGSGRQIWGMELPSSYEYVVEHRSEGERPLLDRSVY